MHHAERLAALCLLLFTIGIGNALGMEGDVNYTPNFTKLTSGTNYNSYASAHTVTVSYKGWSLIGNQSIDTFLGVGGKNTTATDRTSYSTSGIGSTTIGKVRITTGGTGGKGTMTFSKLVLEVSSKSDFSDIIDTKTNNSPNINGDNDFTPTSPLISWPAGSYYRIKFNVKNSQGSDNGYFKVNSVTFYEGASGGNSVAVTGVTVAPTSQSIVPDETFTITPTVSPAGASNKSVSWSSNATSYATVSSGVVTGVAAGTATITCTTTGGGFTATCAVTVRGVTVQARDEDGNTIAAGGPGAPTRSGTTITAAANAGNYVFKEWQVTNATAASTTTSPTTISNPTGAVTVTAVYYKPITITYKANGSTFTTQTYAYNGTLAFPASNPDGATYSCTGKTFVGWVGEANKNYSHASTAPTYVSAGGSVTEAATYYAVFADAAGGDYVYTKVTSISAGTYVMVSEKTASTYSYMPNTTSSGSNPPLGSGITMSTTNGVTTLTNSVTAAMLWDFTLKSGSVYYIRPHGSTTIGLGTTNSTGANIRISTTYVDTEWTIATSNDYGWQFKNNASTNMYLAVYADDYWRNYNSSTTNQSGTFYLFKQSGGITYSAYITTCSSDPTLNVNPPALDFGNVAVNSSKDMTFTLSGSNLTSNATISVTGAGYSVSPASVSKGSGTISSETITVTYQPTVTGDSQTGTVTISSAGADDKTVSLTGNSKAAYTVSLPSPSNGIVTADKTSGIMAGETVMLTITPNSGYQLKSISATDVSSNDVTLTGSGTTRTFTMPASDVTVAASFMVRTDYVLVTDISQLADGDIITIATMKGNNAEGYILHDKQNDYRGIKSVTTTVDGKIADSDVEYPILLERIGVGSVWKLYDQRNEGYLYACRGSNYLRTGNSIGYNQEWIIEIEASYKALIHQQACANANCTAESSDRYIEFNISSDRLSGYLNTEKDGYIYKKELGCDRLPAPTGLNATAVTQTTCTLSWTAVANASGYEVSLDNGSSWTSAGTNTSYNATGLTQGTTYNWKVRATGTGDYCDKGTAAGSTVTMKKAVTVTYNSNGSTGGQLPVTGGVVNLTEGDSYTILGNVNNLTNSGYTFDGWHSSATYNATPAYTIGGTVTVTANITLYANWKPKRDTFIDGVHGTAEQYRDGAGYTVPSCPDQSRATSGDCEQTHYKFIGWALQDADLTTPANIISAGGSKTATGATYYAVWGEEL